jgi:hypothetical protein
LPGALFLSPRALAPADLQLASVYVLPSIAALGRAVPTVTPGASGSLMPAAWHRGSSGTSIGRGSYALTARWLVVENDSRKRGSVMGCAANSA